MARNRGQGILSRVPAQNQNDPGFHRPQPSRGRGTTRMYFQGAPDQAAANQQHMQGNSQPQAMQEPGQLNNPNPRQPNPYGQQLHTLQRRMDNGQGNSARIQQRMDYLRQRGQGQQQPVEMPTAPQMPQQPMPGYGTPSDNGQGWGGMNRFPQPMQPNRQPNMIPGQYNRQPYIPFNPNAGQGDGLTPQGQAPMGGMVNAGGFGNPNNRRY